MKRKWGNIILIDLCKEINVQQNNTDGLRSGRRKLGNMKGLSTENGFGNIGLKKGRPFLNTVYGEIPVKVIMIAGNEYSSDRH